MRCSYCDTKWNWKKAKHCVISEKESLKNPIELSIFKNIINQFKIKYVSFTGGEPLLNVDFIEASLPLSEKKILIETNGTLVEKLKDSLLKIIDYWSVDIKLPSLVEKDFFSIHSEFLGKLCYSKGFVILKVVFSSKSTEEELFKSFELATRFYEKNKNLSLVFQPLTENSKIKFDKRELTIIYKIMEKSRFEVRIIPQLHKILKIK